MATIKERADEFAEREYIYDQDEKERISFGYYHGAKEQRKIDIEKACEWLKQKFRDKNGSIAPLWFVFLDEFKEAMNE